MRLVTAAEPEDGVPLMAPVVSAEPAMVTVVVAAAAAAAASMLSADLRIVNTKVERVVPDFRLYAAQTLTGPAESNALASAACATMLVMVLVLSQVTAVTPEGRSTCGSKGQYESRKRNATLLRGVNVKIGCYKRML